MAEAPSRTHAWLQLLRPPNLFSVPGDPLVGWALAVAITGTTTASTPTPFGALAAACGSVIFLYLMGLVTNDLADYEEDLRDRPDRPIPSGAVARSHAWVVAILFAAIGLGLAYLAGPDSFKVAFLVLLLVLLYNFVTKHRRMTGAVTMGLCRATSVVLGAVIASKRPEDFTFFLTHFYGLLIYIALLTFAADFETNTKRNPVVAGWWPFIVLTITLPAEFAALRPPEWSLSQFGFALLAAAMVGCAFSISHQIHQSKRLHPRYVGQWIRLLIPWQAALLFLVGRPEWALPTLALWPLAWLAAKRFYAS